ncbi:glycosyl hydrolase [Saccharothrix sp. NRRL B-16314]|uniref:glycosyl hydrolase n=1 Tax=Saccharothrix sp. NRRL B-16314 TaxID=1463825 RepID=UPI000689CF70|nr:glycosyl hydrolase [Saccharothrix sp. NRRL B-16314]
MRERSAARRGTVAVVVAALLGAGAVGASAEPTAPGETTGTAERGGRPETVRISDPDATPETRSLYSYLREQQGKGVLFGHQQTTEFGVTWDEVTETDGLKSDVKAGVGDHPALFGWDTGHLGHGSSPGDPAPEENFRATVKLIETAHNEIGGVHTLASHMDNFVTGGSFYDTNGDVVTRILPGGDHNAQFNAYLDRVARLAHEVDDANGNPIPMIYRPFHENSGSWFWWGAAHASPAKYVELFRYTVEYLRDVKDVHNFLYAYSPGGGYGGVDDVYMRTYPGDNYIDVFGIDSYDGSNGSQQWLDGIVADLGMIARIAAEKGKVSAFTEYGISGALKPNGQNGNLNWFTTMFDAIKADPWASRSAFMLTWVNFGTEQFFLPYPATATEPEHELLPDLKRLHADPFAVFSQALDLGNVYGRKVRAEAHRPFMHIVSPTDGERVVTPTTTIRVRLLDAKATSVHYTVGDDPTRHRLTLDRRSGYYTGTWDIGAENLTNKVTQLKVTASTREPLVVENRVILGEKPPLAPGVVDDFEGHVDDTALAAEYSPYGTNTISLAAENGGKALKFDYDFGFQTYTGIGKRVSGDWSAYSGLSLWLRGDGSNHKLVLQLNTGGVAYEAYPSLAGTTAGVVTIPFADWRPAPWDTGNAHRRITPEDLANLSQFNIFINQVEGNPVVSGSFHLDDIRAH